ncbi:MAG: septal ring lytic transglycosylase RlpA family protein [Coriobacteriia bacterium]|nr:septal ring lytic transglycosylase RlpA family protein [Coriobacteriia bacterium]
MASPLAAVASPSDTSGQTSPPLAGLSAEAGAIRDKIDVATDHVISLENEIAALEAEQSALDERLAVTAGRIVAQREAVAQAEIHLAEAEARFQSNLVQIYKRGSFDPLAILLNADTLPELFSRADALSRIAEDDDQVVADLNIATADARYTQTQLEELLAQDRALRAQQQTRHEQLTTLLNEQNVLIDQLTADERDVLEQVRVLTAELRTQWQDSSVPIATDIARATATVDVHPGVEYLVSAYMPREYRSTGEVYSAVCSWYGPGFHGRTTASGQVFNQDDLTCASRTLPFGTVLALTRGSRRVIVYVNDRGPFIAGRDLDLSKAAAAALGFSGVESVQVEVVTAVK